MRYRFFVILLIYCLFCRGYSQEDSLKEITTAEQLIFHLVNANYHQRPYLRTAHLFKVEENFFAKIREEVLDLIQNNTPSEVKNKGHVTNWTNPWGSALQFSLLNSSGKYNDFSVDHNLSLVNKKFHEKELYPNLSTFISLFPHAVNFRINFMSA